VGNVFGQLSLLMNENVVKSNLCRNLILQIWQKSKALPNSKEIVSIKWKFIL